MEVILIMCIFALFIYVVSFLKDFDGEQVTSAIIFILIVIGFLNIGIIIRIIKGIFRIVFNT